MLKINGKYNEALVYADIIDDGTIEQIKEATTRIKKFLDKLDI